MRMNKEFNPQISQIDTDFNKKTFCFFNLRNLRIHLFRGRKWKI